MNEISHLRIGQSVWYYIRPTYYRCRVESVGYDWAVVRRTESDRIGVYLITPDEQWSITSPYDEEDE